MLVLNSDDNKNDSDLLQNSEGFGFFLQITDTTLFEKIKQKVEYKKYFTDRVVSDRVSVRLSDIALVISPEKSLIFVSHVRPTRSGSTGTRGFKASGPLRVDLSADEIISDTGEEHKNEILKGFNEPSFRPSLSAWKAIWSTIKKLRPNLSAQIRHIEQLRFDEAFEFSDDSDDEQFFYEKDAVGVALDVAGISFGGVFAELTEGREQNKSLIEALCGNPTEDVILNHDVHNFPDYVVHSDYVHACEFMQHGRRLTIFNVNRRKGERALGVDLIYHNVNYNAFTFIQYKMLQREGSKQVPAWRYRPDKQFDEESSRMRLARTKFKVVSPNTPDLYRFCQDPFFFKLCRRQQLKVNSGQLASGVYLNLTHCDLVLSGLFSNAARILEPGKNVDRWLNRTLFTDLIARGWVGTNNVTPEILEHYIADAIDSGRSVLIAKGESRLDNRSDDDNTII